MYDFPCVLSTNITGGLCDKITEINEIATIHNADVLCITESWCSDKIPDACLQIPGYSLYRRDRQDGRAGGGIVCYIRNCIPIIKCWTELNNEDLETLYLTLSPRKLPRGISHISLGVVYHPPKSNDWAMCQHLIECVDTIKQKYPMSGFITAGDFNHMKDKYFKNSCQFYQIVTKPTHGNSVIDLFYTSLKEFYCTPLHEPGIGLSKHQTLIFQPVSFNPLKNKQVIVTKRDQSLKNKEALKHSLSNTNWAPVYRATTCQEKFEIFENIMNDAMNTYLPLHTVKRNSNDFAWVTDHFRSLIKKRQHHFNSGNLTMFRFYRNKVNRERKMLKAKHINGTLNNLKQSNPRNWWKCIKSLTGLSNKCDSLEMLAQIECNGDMGALADKINICFKDVSSHISPLNHITYEGHVIPSEYIIPEAKVEQQLRKINITKAIGPDNIPNWILKDLSYVLAGPICSIWNSSFQDGYIPPIWKAANTCPLPKVSPPTNIKKDLRPISLTPTLSKGIELHARDWFLNFFKPHIDEFQYGSQSESSTVIALAQLLHNWLLNIDSGKKVIRILLIDFSKAFDLVDHNILIEKLADIGIPGFLKSWIYSFLCDRKQRIKIGDTLSEWESVNAGVPQGTLLGPSTFLLHINNLKTACNSVKYVDDTTIWECCDRLGTDSKIQVAANQTLLWCTENNMKINTDKTKEMLINFSKSSININPIKFNDTELEQVKNTKLLGVIINNTLSWADHVNYICTKASKRIYFLRLLKRASIPSVEIVNVYCSIIRSLLEYDCEIWHTGLTKQQTKQIEVLQKRALKIAFPETSYDPALILGNIPTLENRRQDRCKKFFNDICKPNHKLHNLLPPRNTVSHLRTKREYHLPKVRTNRLKNSPVFYGIFNFQ